jgi:hypothetical protein
MCSWFSQRVVPFCACMSVLPQLSDDLREALGTFGIPLPLLDPESQETYALLAVEVANDPLGGFLASIKGIPAFGSGETPEEATLALMAALQKSLDSLPAQD